ncbi:FadR/GntR family transcriptional regulator [Brevibacterium oceani]|uniref:FadR/GntR family transcriptional regulator n=1 Tax=Brevibacterium oceani TaxID=358099 RepID=UPI0015E76E68|nr:FadR/GntR family transcriptional regulator [Brevibacterium oceani]
MTFTPVERSRAFESVVDQIEEAIYSGELAPGDTLPSERALVETFQVSRSSIREALRILESMGLITTRPGSKTGPLVSLHTRSGITRLLAGTLRTKGVSLADLIQYRMVSGEMANRLACARRTDADLEELETLVAKMQDALDDGEFAQLDAQFHERIRSIAGNHLMSLLNSSVQDVIVDQVSSLISSSDRPSATREEFNALHREIIVAIRERNAGEAGRIAKQSLYDTYSHLVDEKRRVELRMLL